MSANEEFKDIYLLVYDLDQKTFEVCPMHLWLKTEQNLFLQKKKSSYVIVSAHWKEEDAEAHMKDFTQK